MKSGLYTFQCKYVLRKLNDSYVELKGIENENFIDQFTQGIRRSHM
jgi:hypothetical protein